MYNPEQDGRRSAPKAYVASLEERIRALEGVLSAHGIDEHTPMPESKPKDLGGGGSGSDRDGKAADQGGEGQDLDREGEHGRRGIALVNSGERLKMDESTGELLECGPTSLFSRRTAEGGDKSPASVLTPGSIGGNAVDRPAVLHPRPNSGPELASPELDALLHDEVLRLFFEYFNT